MLVPRVLVRTRSSAPVRQDCQHPPSHALKRLFSYRKPDRVFVGLLITAAMIVPGCQRPGEGEYASNGYARSRPVIEALQRFHEEQKRYPEALAALVPRFIDGKSLSPPASPPENFPFEYRLLPDGQFELAFLYARPGMNRCTFASRTRSWACRGAF